MANDDLSISDLNKSIDECLLIELVKEHPVVWDLTEDNYRKKVSCNQAWATICRRLVAGYESYEDKATLKSQHGFIKGRSTTSAIIKLAEFIIDSLEEKNLVTGIMLDFSKAFDCLGHELILNKLEQLGVKGQAYVWFKSYLEGRSQEGKEVKKKWTNLRDCYNKSRKAGKESISKYKSLDFLSKVYEEKDRRGSLFSAPSKEKVGAGSVPVASVDPDADTQLNSSLPRSCRGEQTNTYVSRVRAALTRSSEPVGPGDGIHSQNVMMEECDSSKDDHDDESLDEDVKDMQPHCSTTSTGGQLAQNNVGRDVKDEEPHCSTNFAGGESTENNIRRGVKRPLEENDGDQHLIQFIKSSLTKNFNQSQNKKFRSEMLQLLESACDDFDSSEIEDLNIKILEILLSTMKNLKLEKKCEMIKQIICCVGIAQHSIHM